jgi:peroxiredoxin
VIVPSNEKSVDNVRALKNSALLQKMAPDFTLPNANSEPVTLKQLLDEGHRALVVFLRHLG